MKVGSIVECVSNFTQSAIFGESYPVAGKTYTVREIVVYEIISIKLEEIVNPSFQYNTRFTECSFNIEKFREIEFPPALEAEIKECLTREFQEK